MAGGKSEPAGWLAGVMRLVGVQGSPAAVAGSQGFPESLLPERKTESNKMTTTEQPKPYPMQARMSTGMYKKSKGLRAKSIYQSIGNLFRQPPRRVGFSEFCKR